VVGSVGGTAFGDIALVPAPFLKHPKGIRDVAEWYMSTVSRREYVHAVFSAQCDFALANLERVHAEIGGALDALFVCGTDFGTQSSSFCSVDAFRELYMPYYARVNDWIHRHTLEKLRTLRRGERFIRPSSSALRHPEPGAVSGQGMDLEHSRPTASGSPSGAAASTLRRRVRDTQEVREQVRERCEACTGRRLVFNAIHNVQVVRRSRTSSRC
jgi:hypothetical protein